jgi:5-oxoprolinase (ATP-hydrolysing) subunit A
MLHAANGTGGYVGSMTDPPVVDLNCDLGEGFGVWRLGDDDALLEVVTSANVACGFHGGDPLTMHRVCERAVARGVAIGAQVGYRDLAGFGRRYIDMPAAELTAEVIYQIGALDGFCRIAGDRVRYVKPHGALYHAAATDPAQAGAVVAAVRGYDPGLPVLCLPGTELARQLAAGGLTAVPEAFADRAYRPDGGLVARGEPGAVLHDVAVVAARCVRLARDHLVESVDGVPVEVAARSICVHGDTPGAVEVARAVRAGLDAAGVRVARFAGFG